MREYRFFSERSVACIFLYKDCIREHAKSVLLTTVKVTEFLFGHYGNLEITVFYAVNTVSRTIRVALPINCYIPNTEI